MGQAQEFIGGAHFRAWEFPEGANLRKAEKLKRKIYRSCKRHQGIPQKAVSALLRMKKKEEPVHENFSSDRCNDSCESQENQQSNELPLPLGEYYYQPDESIDDLPNTDEARILQNDLRLERWKIAKALQPSRDHLQLAMTLDEDIFSARGPFTVS